MAAHRMRGPCHDLLTDRGHLATVAGDCLGRRALRVRVLGFRDVVARGCAPRWPDATRVENCVEYRSK